MKPQEAERRSHLVPKILLFTLLMVLLVLVCTCLFIYAEKDTMRFDYNRTINPNSTKDILLTKDGFSMNGEDQKIVSIKLDVNNYKSAHARIMQEQKDDGWNYSSELTAKTKRPDRQNTLIFRKGTMLCIVSIARNHQNIFTATKVEYSYQK